MADSSQKKNKKNKKKQDTSVASVSAPAEDEKIPSITVSSNCTQKNITKNINSKASEKKEPSPPDSGCPQGSESTNKKKKKNKKKTKEMSKEAVNENNKSGSLLNFSENGIQLLNHPEISVTISDPSESKDDEAKSLTDKIPPLDKDKEIDNSASASNKKQKKKKKKKPAENVPVDIPVSNETSFVTPTYTKVVTSDNTCVLVVNNEFSVDSKSFDSSESTKNKTSDNSVNFRLTSDKQLGDVLLTKNFTPDTTMKFSNSVSIFPVLSAESSDSKQSICMNHNLEMNSNDLKAETNGPCGKENIDESQPSKAQLKAERRAKQEAQRAAKLAKTNVKTDSNTTKAVENKSNTPKEKKPMKESNSKVDESVNEKHLPAKIAVEKEALHKVKLFSHLPQFKKFNIDEKIHPAVLEVGYQYNKGIICGSNARCIALLHALKEVIKDHTPLPDKNFCRDLESSLQTNLNYLSNCRPLSVSMISAVKFLKYQINHLPSNLEVDQMKENLCCQINNFVKEDILVAKEAICNVGSFKIVDSDVILVFAYSSLVIDVLNSAHNKKKSFRVIVVDSRPKVEGLKMLQSLVKQGIHCSYTSINAISYVMKEVTKVYLGAHALLANGCVISRIGNKQIALMAMSYSVPVFVCCETYKFCERVLTDSFVHNELGDPDDVVTPSLVSNESLKNWHDLPSLQPLNLLYDLITPDLIFEVVTEKGAFPCNAVPVLLRVRYAGLHD